MRTSFATGLPCLVMTMPWSSTRSRRERHCSLNLDALIDPTMPAYHKEWSFILTGHINWPFHFPSAENASSALPGIPPMAPYPELT